MSQQVHAETDSRNDLFSCRVARIGLDAAKLTPEHRAIFNDIRARCPNCKTPHRCVADLAFVPPKSGLEGWDEYCPNAARLRILAALTMFSGDAPQDA